MTIFFLAVQSYFDAGASMALNTPFPMSADALNDSRYLENCQQAYDAAHQSQCFAGQMLGQFGRVLKEE